MDGEQSIAEAAAQLGLTPQAVRKRLQRGQLPGYKRDGFWVVAPRGRPSVDSVSPSRDGIRPPEDGIGPEVDASRSSKIDDSTDATLVDELRGELASVQADKQQLWVALEREQVANAELRVLLQRALERQPVLELPAATMPVAEPFTEPAHAEAPPPAERRRRGFWAWLRAGAPHGG